MSFEIQQKIKHNALEIKEYVTDLYDWEKQMELKEKVKANLRKSQKSKDDTKQHQIRQSKIQYTNKQTPNNQQIIQKRKDLTRDVNTVGDYYKAWDKFDAQKQLKRLQEQQQKAYRPYNPYQDSKNILRAKPKTKININGRRNQYNDPTQLKDKGNLHFQSLQYQKAINCYSQCLKKFQQQNISFEQLSLDKKKLRCVVLSNRAMAYLKIQQTTKALADANESLIYNKQYSKSYYRRGECYKKLGKYKQSLRDFRTVLKLQPNQSKAEIQIKKIEAFLAKRSRQLRQSMVIPYNEGLLYGGRRIQIDEVAQFPTQSNLITTNYLEQL